MNIQTQSYLALLATETLNDIAGIVTGSLLASGSGGDGDDDDNDSTRYSFDVESEPLTVVFGDREYPEQGSAAELIRKNQENKRRLLKILRKKMQQAIAGGNGDLARILDNRIMLIEADLEYLTDLDVPSAERTANDQGSPGVLSVLKVSLATDSRELQQRDDNALLQALAQYGINPDYRSILIISSELTHEEALFYERWQDTATGLVYDELRRRLEQQLQPETDDMNVSTEKTGALVDSLKALVQQFWEMFSADLSSQSYERQVPDNGEGNETSSPSTAGRPAKRLSPNARANDAFQSKKDKSYWQDDEGEEPPGKHEHTYSSTIDCPLCHGPCDKEKPEACAQEPVNSPGRVTAPENDWILPPPLLGLLACPESKLYLEKLRNNTKLEYRIYTSNAQVKEKLNKQQETAIKQQKESAERFEKLQADSKNGRKISRRKKNVSGFQRHGRRSYKRKNKLVSLILRVQQAAFA